MSDYPDLIHEIKKEFLLRICEEGIPRIIKCLNLISEEDIWIQPNKNIPSIGNLILHLNGNVSQWFLDGFCEIDYTRTRDFEFSARKSHTKEQLEAIILTLSKDIENNINAINYNMLIKKKTVQNHFTVSGFSIINHVTEHFSYHVGQISTLTKLLTNKDLGYYKHLDL